MSTPAHRLADLAWALVPPEQRIWAEAMRREVRAIEHPADALDFALGCLNAAIIERIAAMKIFLLTARWGLGLGALAFAAGLLVVAGAGVSALDGSYPAYERLLAQGDASGAAAHRGVLLPATLAWMAGLAIAAAGAGIAWLRKGRRGFFGFCALGAAIAAAALIPTLSIDPGSVNLVVGLAILPLLALAGVGGLLLRLDRDLAAA